MPSFLVMSIMEAMIWRDFSAKLRKKPMSSLTRSRLVSLRMFRGRIAAAKIIEPDFVAGRSQLADGLLHDARISGQRAFRYLDMQDIARQTITVHHCFDGMEDIERGKIKTGEIERDWHKRAIMAETFFGCAADFLQHEYIQLVDLLRLFEGRNEGSRGQKADLRINPAESVKAAEITGQRVDYRLVINLDPAVFDGIVDMMDDVLTHFLVDGRARRAAFRIADQAVKQQRAVFFPDEAARKFDKARAAEAGNDADQDMAESFLFLQMSGYDLFDARDIFGRSHVQGPAIDMSARNSCMVSHSNIRKISLFA